jgi:hypothetical protein
MLFTKVDILTVNTEVEQLEKENLEKIREKLYLLISEDSDYSEILKVSQELDCFITEFTSVNLYR